MITRILPTEQKGNFKKRDFHVLVDSKKEYGIITFYNDCAQLTDLNIKDIVEVDVEIQSKNWNGRIITNLVSKKINLLDNKGTIEAEEDKKKLIEFRRNPRKLIQVDLRKEE